MILKLCPITGKRLDLDVYEEPEAVAAARWRAKRITYLGALLEAPDLSPAARESYTRELERLR